MNAVTAIALSKAAADAAKGASLTPGEYAIDDIFTVRIVGTVRKGEDVEYTPTTSIPLKEALALALHYAGCTRDRAQQVIVKAMTAALNGEAESIKDALPDVDAAMEYVQGITEALPKKTRAGAVTAKLSLQVEEMAETMVA